MLTKSERWQVVVAAWPPRRDLGTLMRLPPAEAAGLVQMPIPDISPLADAASAGDIAPLCAVLAANTQPESSVAHNVLFRLAERQSPLLTAIAYSSWLRAVATAKADVLAAWRSEPSLASLSKLYNEFLDRVPTGVSFRELVDVMAPVEDEEITDGVCWANCVAEGHEIQMWSDEAGRYGASKFS